MSCIELAVFDLAGTTVEDPDGVGGCLRAALADAGVCVWPDRINAIMGLPKPVAIAMLIEGQRPGGGAADPHFIFEIHRDFQSRMIRFYREDPRVREVEGAREVFRTLRSRGIKVALDTGFSRAIVDVLLARIGWGQDLIDATVTSDEVAQGRPFPDMVFRAMELTGVGDVTRVAKVGDTPSDLHEGTAAGCGLVVGVTSGTHEAEQLLPFPHTHLIPSIRELSDLIEQFERTLVTA